MEDVWLADVSTNGQYRVSQHFYDALGRETNTVVVRLYGRLTLSS